MATAGDDGTVRLWDARGAKQIGKPLRGHADFPLTVAFSPDGRTLASGSADRTTRLWDVGTRKQLGGPLTTNGGIVISLAFSPDGRTLASGSADKAIRLWDVRTHTQLGPPLRTATPSVRSLAFSPDGRTLAAGDGNVVRVWRNILWRNTGELRDEVCRFVGTGLDRAEWAQYAAGISYRASCPP
jgi:WD40 repeat protein